MLYNNPEFRSTRRGILLARSVPEAVQDAGQEEAALARLFDLNLSKRGLGKLAVGTGAGLLIASVHTFMQQAVAEAQSGRWSIVDIPDYERGRGRWSHQWLRGTKGYNIGNFDQATTNYTGITLPQSTSDYLNDHTQALINRTPGGIFWVGDCRPAALASADCPPIVGEREAFGVKMPEAAARVLAVLHYRYTKTLLKWTARPGRGLTAADFNDIVTWYNVIQEQGLELVMIANTTEARGFGSNQEWNCLVDGIVGASLKLVDFLEEDIPGQLIKKSYGPLSFDKVTSISLVHPNEPHPGQEDGFNKTVNRNVAKVFLGKARAIPR